VLNECRDAARKAEREHPTREAQPADPGELDEVDKFGDLLMALPFRQRAAIVLRYYGGYSEVEIAKESGLPAGNRRAADTAASKP
jgi:DNA-directed RNA polymerase specialized sigma24 family protein